MWHEGLQDPTLVWTPSKKSIPELYRKDPIWTTHETPKYVIEQASKIVVQMTEPSVDILVFADDNVCIRVNASTTFEQFFQLLSLSCLKYERDHGPLKMPNFLGIQNNEVIWGPSMSLFEFDWLVPNEGNETNMQ